MTSITGGPMARKMGAIQRKEVSLADVPRVDSHPLTEGSKFIQMYEPASDDVDLVGWVRHNREQLEADLLVHGALLLRGFHAPTVADFEQATQAFYGELYGGYGDLPRAGASENIYKSTPYPADKAILYHNESSHLDSWPMKIGFFCVQKAPVGGATPLMDCREVCNRIDPEIFAQFAEKGLTYVRTFVEGVDVSWRHFFQTDDKAEVEARCREAGVEFEWTDNDGLRTKQNGPAVVRHPKTGETIFFNQVQLHHPYCLDPETRESLMSLFGEEYLPRNVYFGDGSKIEDSVMAHLGEVFEQIAVRADWNEGDIALLDNMMTAHARDPYSGPRKIVVAMGQMFSKENLK
ncbi:syrP protein [Capsulimonas corticalis]|uniref:SyrP protein n=1 Tax=Capsulimonas corticalis TaxID=2219043 RepID=A0A402CVM2_9BACT|nr:TauD/TfdA family dioxygenase [Capsulimonas corticalis]BDI30446.1 syrP protein [Capsulimonas corticalis]